MKMLRQQYLCKNYDDINNHICYFNIFIVLSTFIRKVYQVNSVMEVSK